MNAAQREGRLGAAAYFTIFIVILYLGFELYALQNARERAEPTAVYRQFVGARRAAALCDDAPPVRADFERNFLAVTQRARKELQEQQPEADAGTIDASLADLRRAREAEVDALIGADGCAGQEARRLLKLYEIRSRLNLHPARAQ
jgi:hypothetical protein